MIVLRKTQQVLITGYERLRTITQVTNPYAHRGNFLTLRCISGSTCHPACGLELTPNCSLTSRIHRPPIDLIICDEGMHQHSLRTAIADDITGHRLKSTSNKTRDTFNAFRTQRKIILSGTPIQNDLREFHAMVMLFLFSLVVY